jgi:hypothetical protein
VPQFCIDHFAGYEMNELTRLDWLICSFDVDPFVSGLEKEEIKHMRSKSID